MYNGIGLETARGSGTNGYVQRNLAFVRVQRDRNTYKSEEEINASEARIFREPNKEILEHERKRRIENKVVEMEDLMEEQGYNAEEIAEKVTKYRQFLLEKEGECDLNTQKTEDGRITAKGSHEMRAVTQQKNALFRDAVKINEDFVEGTSLQKKKEKKEAELVKMITTGNFAILPDSSDEEKSQRKPSDDKKSKKVSKKKKQSSSKKKRKKKSNEPRGDNSDSESNASGKSNSSSSPVKLKHDDRKDKRKHNNSPPDTFKLKRQQDGAEKSDSHRRNFPEFDRRYGWASHKEKKDHKYPRGRDEEVQKNRRHSPESRTRRDAAPNHRQQERYTRPRHDSDSRKRRMDERAAAPLDVPARNNKSRPQQQSDSPPVPKKAKLHDDHHRNKPQPRDEKDKRHKSKKSKRSVDKNSDGHKKRHHKKHEKTKKRKKSVSLD